MLIGVLQCPALANAAPETLLVVGDSLSAAYGLRQEEGWVALLAARIRQQKLDYNVVNASISGETTAGGAARLPDLLDRHHPSLVLIALGGNDGLRGTPVATMRAQLSSMLELCKQRKIRVLIAGIEIPPNYGAAYAGEFGAAFTSVARQFKVPLVPSLLHGFGTSRELFQGDGIHPIATAEPRVLANVWPVLEPMLARRKP